MILKLGFHEGSLCCASSDPWGFEFAAVNLQRRVSGCLQQWLVIAEDRRMRRMGNSEDPDIMDPERILIQFLVLSGCLIYY